MPDEYDDLLNGLTRTAPRAYRTDRNNNPIAAAVGSGGKNQFTKALDDAGIPWEHGDIFPGNEGGASMRTIRIKGDPYDGARAILSGSNAIQGWYAKSTGKTVLPKYGVRTNKEFAALPRQTQDEIINGIYQSEGGSGALKPRPVDEYDSLLDSLATPQPSVQRQGRGAGMARSQQVPRRQVRGAQPNTSSIPLLGTVKAMRRKIAQGQVQQPIPKDFVQQEIFNTAPDMSPRGQAARQVGEEMASGADQVTYPLLHPLDAITKSRERVFNERVNERVAQQERSQSPEVIAGRKAMGQVPGDIGYAPPGISPRGVATAATKFGGGLVKAAGGLLDPSFDVSGAKSILQTVGVPLDKARDYLNKKGQYLEDIGSQPLNEQGKVIERGLPEKVTDALTTLGLSLGEIVLLKKATGMSLGSIMATESVLKNSDKPVRERATDAAAAYGMGKVLDQHLSRPLSAVAFGAPTALETGSQYAQGNMSLEDALLQTGIQAGTGAVLGGKPTEAREPVQTVPEAMQNRVKLGDVSEQAKQAGAEVIIQGEKPKVRLRNAQTEAQPNIETQPESAQPAPIVARTGIPRAVDRGSEPSTNVGIPESGAGVSKPTAGEPLSSSEPPRHVDLQPRRVRGEGKGQFKSETRAEREARRQQVNLPAQPESTASASGVSVPEGKPLKAQPTGKVEKFEVDGRQYEASLLDNDVWLVTRPDEIGSSGVKLKYTPRGLSEQEMDAIRGEASYRSLSPQPETKASSTLETSPVVSSETPQDLIQSPGRQVANLPSGQPRTEPEIKTSKLAIGVEAKAIEAKLTEGFKGLPEYETVKVADQADRAAKLLQSDPEKATRIALGKEAPPVDILPESVFIAVENQALKNGDVDLLRNLATASTLPTEATGMGQRIRMLAERNPNSAVSAIREVQLAREAKAERGHGDLKKARERIKTEIQIEVKKAAPKARDWASFLSEISCK